MRGPHLAVATLVVLMLPATGRAEGLWSSFVESARRTPNGIAFEHPDAGSAEMTLENDQPGVPEPETGSFELKFNDTHVSFAARQSLGSQFGAADMSIGGLKTSPFLGLRGFGVMAKRDTGTLDLASGFVFAREGQRLAASELSIDTGWSSVLVQGGFKGDVDEEPAFTDGAFGGAVFEGRIGGVGYSMRWHGSFDGSTGALSFSHGNAALGISRDFGAGILSPEPTLTARWQQKLPLGGIDLRLDGKPTAEQASTRVNWTLEW